ncbi:MAG: hypothetical protein ABR878_05135 [Roseiarcus sp.]|jgi:hypothetical protein
MIRSIALALALAWMFPLSAAAGDAATGTRQALESGRFEAGETDLAARVAADPSDNEARFGLGMIRFAEALERFGQRQYRFGLRAPANAMIPVLRLPVPVNPAPEELTYEKQRDNLQGLLDDLAKVEATLAPMRASETKIVIDLNAVKFDFRGDGKAEGMETLGSILANLQSPRGARAAPAQSGPFEVKFDNADAFWLRGYCRLLSASLEFVLAYDWRNTFERVGSLFYPRIAPPRFPPNAVLVGGSDGFLGDAGQIADFIVLIHEIRWPLKEPARLQSAHADLKQVIAMSRASWKSILARTDDDREWIPGPQQKNGVVTDMPVTQAQVDAWLVALDDFDAALDGTKLAPHWRFVHGFNFRRVFFEPRDFDLVLWIAGYGAAPYLEEGPTLSMDDWNQWNQAFGGNFLGYAFWFN